MTFIRDIDNKTWDFFLKFRKTHRVLIRESDYHMEFVTKNETLVKPRYNIFLRSIEGHFVDESNAYNPEGWVFLVNVRGKERGELMTYNSLKAGDPSRLAYYAWKWNLPLMYCIWDWTMDPRILPLPEPDDDDEEKFDLLSLTWMGRNRFDNLATQLYAVRGEANGLLDL